MDLPERVSRGKRYRKVITEEVEADEDFWNQDFFREEEKDSEYESETEEEDVADSDFSDSESVSEEKTPEEENQPRAKKNRLLPPGSAVRRSKEKTPVVRPKMKEESRTMELTLRKSTLRRRSEAEQERQQLEQQREKRRSENGREKIKPILTMTPEEFLREAAEMEVYNLASLNELEIFEEESKKRAMQTKSVYTGPSIRTRSRSVGGVEQTTLELRNVRFVPDWLRSRSKPDEMVEQVCVVTGLPAKYRDPTTKMPYSTVEAFREIRRRYESLKPSQSPAATLNSLDRDELDFKLESSR